MRKRAINVLPVDISARIRPVVERLRSEYGDRILIEQFDGDEYPYFHVTPKADSAAGILFGDGGGWISVTVDGHVAEINPTEEGFAAFASWVCPGFG